ncbi:MAG: hypothetical protein KJ706_05715 [Candidatus Omnitrophica bacterium]|nr:hypothetical protein [Candidatus Omnitrophota bacterium]
MIWDIYNDKEINHIPHKKEYETWVSRLTTQKIEIIKEEIRGRIEGDEVATTGWIPGSDWRNTPFEPIYETACRRDKESAGMCFGLLVWVTLMEHEDCWGFGRHELNNLPIESMTYFKVYPIKN